MNESKKGLRIAAGILLLTVACYSASMTTIAYVSMLRHGATLPVTYWVPILTFVLGVLTAVFILTRRFPAAAAMRCALLAVSAATLLVSFVQTTNGVSFSLDALRQGGASLPASVAMRCASITAAILLIIGLFLHNRKAMPLLIIAAVLSLLASCGQAGATLLVYSESFGFERALSMVGISVIQTIAPAFLALPAWILLGVYFGAQQTDAA